ncbi:hypothetical protein [Alkalihalobacillus sp. LMS39]|uniref:hypothetical protein n=1 Tax=Alkalihalobacillus sp. LMS39 TaxID=2924032 RepID=UPI001FB28FA8|nr:hypothetical protein [Alkalihalobacillus sp. LMS39]UOE96072.1 hypothetical protein MM271_10930 [Alkalihalobacillus sp. LMS39]
MSGNQNNLVDELKSKLRITWNEEDTDLAELLEGGKAYLSALTGASFNFAQEKWPKEILLERCRYVYNNAGDEFEENYADELKRLILEVALGRVGVVNESISGDL